MLLTPRGSWLAPRAGGTVAVYEYGTSPPVVIGTGTVANPGTGKSATVQVSVATGALPAGPLELGAAYSGEGTPLPASLAAPFAHSTIAARDRGGPATQPPRLILHALCAGDINFQASSTGSGYGPISITVGAPSLFLHCRLCMRRAALPRHSETAPAAWRQSSHTPRTSQSRERHDD